MLGSFVVLYNLTENGTMFSNRKWHNNLDSYSNSVSIKEDKCSRDSSNIQRFSRQISHWYCMHDSTVSKMKIFPLNTLPSLSQLKE